LLGIYGIDLGHGRSARFFYLMETGQSSWVTAFLLAGLGHGLSAPHSNLQKTGQQQICIIVLEYACTDTVLYGAVNVPSLSTHSTLHSIPSFLMRKWTSYFLTCSSKCFSFWGAGLLLVNSYITVPFVKKMRSYLCKK